jgi:hypothetical protein
MYVLFVFVMMSRDDGSVPCIDLPQHFAHLGWYVVREDLFVSLASVNNKTGKLCQKNNRLEIFPIGHPYPVFARMPVIYERRQDPR